MKIITKILTKSPLLVSESDSRLYDKSQKEFRGKAYIPGSALKGALRETADSFSHVEKYRLMNESLFGKEGTQTGKLFFSNFIAEESNFIIRTHVVISRKLRVSKKGKLFNSRARIRKHLKR
ncbi:MAG TPA: RAMP superfamily CRISPR-associated protein [Tepiditoga sp.]|nr:RAMP superfamily CRISPR-associated protein [Tepiditoga sp.]